MEEKKQNKNLSLEEENKQLKRANAALRGLNTSLKKEVEKWKALCAEADELNEEKISLISESHAENLSLKSQVDTLTNIVTNNNERIRELEKEANKPWYKKIF